MLLLTFTAGGERYALDVAGVIELVPRVELRAIPHAPPYLAGLLGYRGEVVPVIDLGLLLGSSASSDRLSTRIILVKSLPGDHNQGDEAQVTDPREVRLIALIAEQVSDLIEISAEQVVPSPVHLPRAPYLDTIARTDRGFVPMIAVAKLAPVLGLSSWAPGGVGEAEEIPVRIEADDEPTRLDTPMTEDQ